MKDHKISWLNMPGYKGETWNPIVGCSKISEGCDNCYAERMAKRLKSILSTEKERLTRRAISYRIAVDFNGKWSGVAAFTEDVKPLFWKSPRMIFVCSMADFFHQTAREVWQREVFETIEKCPQHIFIILTKRPQNALDFFRQNPCFENLPNVWMGVTAENQERANERIPILLQIKAAKRFVSIEPMLGPIDFDEFNLLTRVDGKLTCVQWYNEGIDWVICGGETGHKARPMHPDWVRSLRDQCQAAQVPFFFKQMGEWSEWVKGKYLLLSNPINRYEYEKGMLFKIGHKAAGRLLDGVEYNEFPEVK